MYIQTCDLWTRFLSSTAQKTQRSELEQRAVADSESEDDNEVTA